ncbi:MAG: hypothetical protein A2W31_01550 [Planctomycetes bacterium RBG_16_64_10]|nr:MAG: hypothetical protein A2W31_01550 [Planctomycetes bacterium RBG_16_64_10]
MKRLPLMLLLAATTLFTLGVSCKAQANGCCGGGPYWWGFHGFYGNAYYPSDRRIPYFAEHPPVYYSYPVPRTYGYSPYASPPTYTEPELRVDPVIIPNPYVPVEPTSTGKAKPADRSAAKPGHSVPLVITNPYFQPTQSLASRP